MRECRDGGFVIAGCASERLVYLIKTDSAGVVYVGAKEAVPAPSVSRQIEAIPNPFTRTCVFRLSWPLADGEALTLHDASGRLVRTLSGSLNLKWDGTDSEGRRLPAGIYFCTLDNGAKRISRKLVLTD